MVEELKILTLVEQVNLLMGRRGLTYDMLIPSINAQLPVGITPVKARNEISRALRLGYSRKKIGKKNDAIIDAVKKVLGIPSEEE